jgi:hypothetical protein
MAWGDREHIIMKSHQTYEGRHEAAVPWEKLLTWQPIQFLAYAFQALLIIF